MHSPCSSVRYSNLLPKILIKVYHNIFVDSVERNCSRSDSAMKRVVVLTHSHIVIESVFVLIQMTIYVFNRILVECVACIAWAAAKQEIYNTYIMR